MPRLVRATRIRGLEIPRPEAAEIIVLTVPHTAHLSTLESVKTQVRGKISSTRRYPSTPIIHVA
jgi:predicted dinucleotide-binding enzyme